MDSSTAATSATATASNPCARAAVTSEPTAPGGGAVSASIVQGDDLDVTVIPASVRLLVLDAQVGKMHLFVEIWKVMITRPQLNFFRVAIRRSVRIVPITIAFMQPALIVALEFVVEDDAVDACAALCEPLRFAKVGAIDLGIVFHFARLPKARVELLLAVTSAVQSMVVQVVAAPRFQQLASLFRQHQDGIAMAVQAVDSDKSFFTQVP